MLMNRGLSLTFRQRVIGETMALALVPPDMVLNQPPPSRMLLRYWVKHFHTHIGEVWSGKQAQIIGGLLVCLACAFPWFVRKSPRWRAGARACFVINLSAHTSRAHTSVHCRDSVACPVSSAGNLYFHTI